MRGKTRGSRKNTSSEILGRTLGKRKENIPNTENLHNSDLTLASSAHLLQNARKNARIERKISVQGFAHNTRKGCKKKPYNDFIESKKCAEVCPVCIFKELGLLGIIIACCGIVFQRAPHKIQSRGCGVAFFPAHVLARQVPVFCPFRGVFWCGFRAFCPKP